MTPNSQKIRDLAIHAWSADLPVSWAIARATELKLYKPWIKRFIETIYDEWDACIDVWYPTITCAISQATPVLDTHQDEIDDQAELDSYLPEKQPRIPDWFGNPDHPDHPDHAAKQRDADAYNREVDAAGGENTPGTELMFVVFNFVTGWRLAAFPSYDEADAWRRSLTVDSIADNCLVEAVEEDGDLYHTINR